MTDRNAPPSSPAAEVIRIGRAEDNDAVIDDSFVSKYHVELARLASGWDVRDLGSSNGTILNGVQVRSAVARFGDTLRIGDTAMALDPDGIRLLKAEPTLPRRGAEEIESETPSEVGVAELAPSHGPGEVPSDSVAGPIRRMRIVEAKGLGAPDPRSTFRQCELQLFAGWWAYADLGGGLIASGLTEEISGVGARRSGDIEITLTPVSGETRWLRIRPAGHARLTLSEVQSVIEDSRVAGRAAMTPPTTAMLDSLVAASGTLRQEDGLPPTPGEEFPPPGPSGMMPRAASPAAKAPTRLSSNKAAWLGGGAALGVVLLVGSAVGATRGVDYDSLEWLSPDYQMAHGVKWATVPYDEAVRGGLECEGDGGGYCHCAAVQAPPEGCSDLMGRAQVRETGSRYWGPQINWYLGPVGPSERSIVTLESDVPSGQIAMWDMICLPPV